LPVGNAREALWVAIREGAFAATGIDSQSVRASRYRRWIGTSWCRWRQGTRRTRCDAGFSATATWIARAYDDAGKYRTKSLGDFGTLAGNEFFAAAKKEAEAFADLVESGGEVRKKIETVADACRHYAATHADAQGRLDRLVYGDPLANVKLDKLRKRHLEEWRVRSRHCLPW
jgi:hypothetical protein